MPTYEYRCQACGHELEAFQKITDARARDCPECGKPKLERLISAATSSSRARAGTRTSTASTREARATENARRSPDESDRRG